MCVCVCVCQASPCPCCFLSPTPPCLPPPRCCPPVPQEDRIDDFGDGDLRALVNVDVQFVAFRGCVVAVHDPLRLGA